MVSALRVLIKVLCVVAFAAPVCAQEIANWPAPLLWLPAARLASGDSGRALSTQSIAATQASSPLPFIGLTPCRIADTRNPVGPYGAPALTGGGPRDFTLTGQCGIPASAEAVSLNITVTNTLGPGFILIYPQGAVQPLVSTLNYVTGQTVANAAVVPLGTGGGVTVIAGVSGSDLIIDTNGYYGSPAANSSNVFLGPGAGNTTMTGPSNTAIGSNALAANTTGGLNTASGADALRNNTAGALNTGNGVAALFSNTTGGNNTASGEAALALNTIGSGNTASGVAALQDNTIGNSNTASGFFALFSNTTGDLNTASGHFALQSNTTGSDNIAIGEFAGFHLTTGDSNIDIGNLGVAGESNTIRIGDGQTQAFLAGVRGITTGVNDAVAVMIDSAGQLGTVSSSRRFKQDIEDMGEASQALMKLRPVTFRYKASLDPTGAREYGLIAEEVAEVFPDLVVYDKGGEPETVRYHILVPMLLNEVQKARKTIADLAARLERLEALMSESIR